MTTRPTAERTLSCRRAKELEGIRLRAAVKAVVDFAEVGNAFAGRKAALPGGGKGDEEQETEQRGSHGPPLTACQRPGYEQFLRACLGILNGVTHDRTPPRYLPVWLSWPFAMG